MNSGRFRPCFPRWIVAVHVVTALAVVGCNTRDSNGVDTVYFETEGGVTSFPPLVGGADSVRYVLPLTTNGQEGQTITLRIFGTDVFGVRGDTAIRHITVQ